MTNENNGITVLADEGLGGVLREYRKMERRAREGDLVEVVSESILRENRHGEVFTVTGRIDGYLVNTDGKRGDGFSLILTDDEYVVLEPKNIVRIGGERYLMVNRKADAGERVIIVDVSFPSNYDLGEVFTADRYSPETIGIIVNELKNRRGENVSNFVRDGKYRVLEHMAYVEARESGVYKIPATSGVTREYRIVDRIGMRGDLVVLGGGEAYITLTDDHLDCGFADENKIGSYHVLESTGVVYIDGKRYTSDENIVDESSEGAEDIDDIDALYDVTTRLTVKMAALERKMWKLEDAGREIAEVIAKSCEPEVVRP